MLLPIIIYIVTVCIEIIIIQQGNYNMLGVIITAGAGALTAIVASLITSKATRKNQIEKNTEAIERLRDDVGRGDNETLSKQHENIKRSVDEKFSIIQRRYEREDESYRAFTQKQVDIKDAIDNFAKDYNVVINKMASFEIENSRLERDNINLKEENDKLKSEINIIRTENEKNKELIEELKIRLDIHERNTYSRRMDDFDRDDGDRSI